jgi:hypothetical protein
MATKKRRASGYFLFISISREEAKAELEAECDEGEKIKTTEVIKKLAKMWKDLSYEDKKFWNLLALAQITYSDSDEEESKNMVSSGYILFSDLARKEAKKWSNISDEDRELWELLAQEIIKGNITVEEALKIEKTHTIIDRKLNKEKLDGGKKLTKKRKKKKKIYSNKRRCKILFKTSKTKKK